MKIKMIVGYRRDQEYSVDMEEAHKAYYLFTHPDYRAIFKNGLAIKGSQIDEIVPDWQGTMGWNPSHALDGDDWNEIRESGLQKKMDVAILDAKRIAESDAPQLDIPLSMVLERETGIKQLT